ncbi:MAG: right-handed parallel beta-helix repeat-containing protein [Chitinispirillaceae bacterium]|nr:right-handed parallel beta-helix repeat-containing protein [Chitinispirillaceae bacterium]
MNKFFGYFVRWLFRFTKKFCGKIILISLVIVTLVLSQQRVGGIILRDTRWKGEDSPFFVESDVVVRRNVRLIIDPGVTVIINPSPAKVDTAVRQENKTDSSTVAIKVYGTLICKGKSNRRIIFKPDSPEKKGTLWYGIQLYEADDDFTELSYTDITGAAYGIEVIRCSPIIRNCIVEYNHIGILCGEKSTPRIYNCVISYNLVSGVKIETSNPHITNNIIAFNLNNGIWCDGVSKVVCTYNCIYGNKDGDLFECDPEIGIKIKKNKKGDSVDVFNNLFMDPVFAGSIADSVAASQDINIPTDKKFLKDTTISSIVNSDTKKDLTDDNKQKRRKERYLLSKYSPCIDAGHPSEAFKDRDGSFNDMGIWGGPEFISKK